MSDRRSTLLTEDYNRLLLAQQVEANDRLRIIQHAQVIAQAPAPLPTPQRGGARPGAGRSTRVELLESVALALRLLKTNADISSVRHALITRHGYAKSTAYRLINHMRDSGLISSPVP